MNNAFSIRHLVKTYPDFKLGPLNLDLAPGMVLGFVGPNGSGKSTTMHCLVGLVRPDTGKIEIFGRENDLNQPAWKFDIGYVGDLHVFYENWSGEKNLQFLSQFYPNWSHEFAAKLAKRLDLPLQKKAKELSTGNRAKLAIVAALAHAPKLLILDEPTAGLDPVARAEFQDVLFELMAEGERAIFYSTHILPEISRLADELAFLQNGQVVLRTAKDDLTEKWRKISFRLPRNDLKFESVVSQQQEGNDYQVISFDFEATLRQLHELGVENVQHSRLSVDEIAVQILKGNHKDARYVESH